MLLLQCGRGTISHRPTSSSIIGIFLNLVVATYESEMMKVWFETNNSTMKKICIPHPHMFALFFGYGLILLKFQQEIVIFYTEILTGKVVLWCFFSSETSEKIHNSTFQVKISVQNVIFSNEKEKKPKYYTYFSIEFGKIYLHLV